MGIYSIIIPTSRGEMELRASVPDQQGFASLGQYHERIIRFLNQKYGLNGWHEPIRTEAYIATERALRAADEIKPLQRQLGTIIRQANNRRKKLENLLG